MKNLFLICLFAILFSFTNAQNSESKSFDKIKHSKNLNEFLDLQPTDEITNFSIALVVDTKLKAFPFTGENVDAIFNKLKKELNTADANSTVKIIVVDLEYASNEDVKSTNNLVYNITDLPANNTMAINE